MINDFLNHLRILLEIVFFLVFVSTGQAVVYLVKAWPEIKELSWSQADAWGWRHIIAKLRSDEQAKKDTVHE